LAPTADFSFGVLFLTVTEAFLEATYEPGPYTGSTILSAAG